MTSTISYSIWDPRREQATARFSSMVPHACPPESIPLAPVRLGIQEIFALGSFGARREKDREQQPAATSHDPRIQSLEQILDRWIDEHTSAPGISLDATQALGEEVEKLLGILVENSEVEVPMTVTLKLRCVVEYIERLAAFWSGTLSALVDASKSDDAWRVPLRPAGEIAQELVQNGMEDAAYRKAGWWLGVLGADSLILPIVGPILKAKSAGWLIAHLQDRRQHRQLMKRLAEHPELVSLHVAKNQLLVVATMLARFFAAQPAGTNTMLYATAVSADESAVFLGPETPRRWYARAVTRRRHMRLAPRSAPSDD
jgi:hypothetical protein